MLLQKQIMVLLRKIQFCVNGVQPAWEETFRNWEATSKMLQSFPKGKPDENQAEIFHRGVGKRRASHQSSEHDIEEQIIEWANMTWFLLALGGICLQRPKTSSKSHMSSHSSLATVASSQTPLMSFQSSIGQSTTSLVTIGSLGNSRTGSFYGSTTSTCKSSDNIGDLVSK